MDGYTDYSRAVMYLVVGGIAGLAFGLIIALAFICPFIC
jgi:hypothetical protein